MKRPKKGQSVMPAAIDYGTDQRHRHGLVQRAPGPDPDHPAGVDVMRFREHHECLLDRLRAFLGRDEKDRARRFEAGEWLRECHHNAGRTPRESMRFEQGDAGTHELSEAQIWNGAAYDDAMRAMGRHAALVQATVVFDRTIRPGQLEDTIAALTAGLDCLAQHRGIGEGRR